MHLSNENEVALKIGERQGNRVIYKIFDYLSILVVVLYGKRCERMYSSCVENNNGRYNK